MTRPTTTQVVKRSARPLAAAGFVLGMGLGGFFDGIVLHQILQWHHLICNQATCRPTSIADLQRKNVADGYFHLGTYLLTVAGCVALFRAARRPDALWSGRVFAGAMLGGWGLFNLAEGLIDHHILRIHHVRPGPHQGAWDLAFLGLGAALLLAGWALIRSAGGAREKTQEPASAATQAGKRASP